MGGMLGVERSLNTLTSFSIDEYNMLSLEIYLNTRRGDSKSIPISKSATTTLRLASRHSCGKTL
jgi:hypothetical protein